MTNSELISKKLEAEILKLLRESETEKHKPAHMFLTAFIAGLGAMAAGIIAYANLVN